MYAIIILNVQFHFYICIKKKVKFYLNLTKRQTNGPNQDINQTTTSLHLLQSSNFICCIIRSELRNVIILNHIQLYTRTNKKIKYKKKIKPKKRVPSTEKTKIPNRGASTPSSIQFMSTTNSIALDITTTLAAECNKNAAAVGLCRIVDVSSSGH